MDDGRPSSALIELVEQHYARLYQFAYRLTGSAADGEDLTQQVFLTAQQKLHQLRSVKNARAWLYTIARHAYFKTLRDDPGQGSIPLAAVAEPAADTPEELLFDSNELQAALRELPEEFRIPIILYYFDEFSYREIAEQMEVPIGTVMSRLARAKAQLRSRLAPAHAANTDGSTPSATF